MSESNLYDSPYEPTQTPRSNRVYNTPRSNRVYNTRKLSPYQTRDSPRFRDKKDKRPWTTVETEILREGMETFGVDWAAIKAFYPLELDGRSNVDLKDRARNVKRMLRRANADLGVWSMACDIKT